MIKFLTLFVCLFMQIINLESAPEINRFESLNLQIPQGSFYPGDRVKCSCATENLEGRLEWLFQIDPLLYRLVKVDSKDDFMDISKVAQNRTSYLTIPSDGATAIACRWVNGHNEYKKIVNIDVLNIRVITPESIYPLLDRSQGPQLVIERFEVQITDPNSPKASKYLPPHIITNETVELPEEIKSFRLSCIYLKNDYADEVDKASDDFGYNWTSFEEEKSKERDPVVLLNSLALVKQKAVTLGRFPSGCLHNGSLRLEAGVRSEVLEVIIPPLNSPRSTKYTCTGSQFQSHVTIRFNGKSNKDHSPKDDEFLQLISTVMQILEASNSSNGSDGGSGSIYGVGFGSSTIIVLMGLTIYYLKRQLKQIQDQVKENECKKRKKTLVTEEEDEDL